VDRVVRLPGAPGEKAIRLAAGRRPTIRDSWLRTPPAPACDRPCS
jgi:hypothetical protein